MKIFLLFLFSFQLMASEDFQKLYQKLGYTDSYFGASQAELRAIEDYTRSDQTYKEVNSFLRYSKKSDRAPKIIKDLDLVFDRVPPLPKDIFLYRGVSLEHRNGVLDIGEEFIDHGYVSTSLNYTTAVTRIVTRTSDKRCTRTGRGCNDTDDLLRFLNDHSRPLVKTSTQRKSLPEVSIHEGLKRK